jgi:hypothetical protein
MERRGEARFPVTSPIRVIVPGQPVRILESNLVDISATGLRFLVHESIGSAAIVGVEVSDRLVLAEIRYCEQRGAQFVIGAHRLHEIDKDAELSDPAACVNDMARVIHRYLGSGDAPDSEMRSLEVLGQIVEKRETLANEAARRAVDDMRKGELADEPASTLLASSIPAPLTIGAAEFHDTNAEPPSETADGPSIPASLPVAAEELSDRAAPPPETVDRPEIAMAVTEVPVETVPASDVPPVIELASDVVQAPTPAPPAETLPVAEPEIKPQQSVEPRPQVAAPAPAIDLLEASRAAQVKVHDESQNQTATKRSWRMPAAIAAGLVLAAAVGFSLLQRRTEAKPVEQPAPNPTAQAPLPPPAAPAEVQPAPAPAATAEVQPAQKPPAAVPQQTAVQHVRIEITESSWISISADNGPAAESVFKQGVVHEFDFSESAILWVGHGEGVRLTVNGVAMRPLKDGVRVLKLTPGKMEYLKGTPPRSSENAGKPGI